MHEHGGSFVRGQPITSQRQPGDARGEFAKMLLVIEADADLGVCAYVTLTASADACSL